MHRLVLIIRLSIALFSIGMSQPIKRYGVKLGIASATWDWKSGGSSVGGINNRLGLNLGAFAEWLAMPTFSLLTEMYFVQKGMKENIPITTAQYPDGTGEFIRYNIRLDYLSFAVLPKLRIETGIVELYAFAGVRLDVSLSNSVNVEGSEPVRSRSAQAFQYLVDRFTSPQFGGTIGIGAQLDSLLPFLAGIEFRYSPNFQSAYSDSFTNIKNTSFELLMTISQ